MQVGDKFGRWTFQGGYIGGKHPTADFLCSCGTARRVLTANVRKGVSTSCGCWNKELRTKHGLSDTPEYNTWMHIKHRCENPEDGSYKDYGAKGVKLFAPWSESFEAFFAYVGPKPSPELSIDRLNTLKGYEPGNVRWATIEVQSNNKRNSVRFTLAGEPKTIKELAEIAGVSYHVMYDRLHRYNFSVEDAIKAGHYERPKTRGSNRGLLYDIKQEIA